MINDDKCRKVAEELRTLEIGEFDDGDFFDCGEVDNVLGLDTDDGAWYEARGVWNLAMLIDRPITNIIVNEHGRTMCISCGCDDWCIANRTARYCPRCGKEIRYG